MNREHYIYKCLFQNETLNLIYIQDDPDGFVTDENGFVLGFESITELRTFAESNAVKINGESPFLLNLNIVNDWLSGQIDKIEDYNLLINAWNFFGDFSTSIHGNFDSEHNLTNPIYDKIFWSCNIPLVTPEGKSFTPEWATDELQIIRRIMTYGLAMYLEKTRVFHILQNN